MGRELPQALVEDQELQHLLGEVLGTAEIVAHKGIHRRRGELTAGRCVEACAETVEAPAEFFPQPALERRVEAALLALQEIRRQARIKRSREQQLRRLAVDLGLG